MDPKNVDQALDLVKQVGQKVGATIEVLWPRAARYVSLDALGTMLGWFIPAAVLIYCSFRLRAYATAQAKVGSRGASDEAFLASMFSYVTLVGSACIIGASIAFFLPRILEPVGYLVFVAVSSVR